MNKHIKTVRTLAVAPPGDDRRRRPVVRHRAARPAPSAAVLASERTGKALSPWVSIARRHDHHHVGGDRDGAGVDDLAAADHRRRARCRLVEGARSCRRRRSRRSMAIPASAGMMYTAGSNAVTSYYTPLRIFGAQVRRVLLDNAANKLGRAGRGIDHRAERGGARRSRAASSPMARSPPFAEMPAKAPEIKPEELKKTGQFRLIGKDVMRVELPGKVNGSATLRDRRAGAGHALRRRAARAGRRIGPGQDRRRQGQGGRRAS